jgi:hypothetical protein
MQPDAVTLDQVAQQRTRVMTMIGTDQLWAALRQWGAATLPGREELEYSLRRFKMRGNIETLIDISSDCP